MTDPRVGAGQHGDAETGLSYNWHQGYDPRLGRYVQSDPIGLAGGLSTYGYANQNPVRYVDPNGQIALVAGRGFRLSWAAGTAAGRALAPHVAKHPRAAAAAVATAGALGTAADKARDWWNGGRGNDWTGPPPSMPVPNGGQCRPETFDPAPDMPWWGPLAFAPRPPSDVPDDEECREEWEAARAQCDREINTPGMHDQSRGRRGGYSSVDDCARGLVSERCGGNYYDRPR